MKNVLDIISGLGFIVFLVGVFNRSKPWSQKLLIIGGFAMASTHFYDAVMALYDGYMGNLKGQ
jgi:hypothetical protein